MTCPICSGPLRLHGNPQSPDAMYICTLDLTHCWEEYKIDVVDGEAVVEE